MPGLLGLFANEPLFAIWFAIAILLGITVHEAAHSWTAKQLGDPTAELAGRVNLNPASHLDPVGTLAIFLIGFGWGRPAPFNPTYFRHYKRDTAFVAVAGPLSNALIVFSAVILLRALAPFAPAMFETAMVATVMANLILAVFNLIPIPPLDGSKLVYAFLPSRFDEAFDRLEQLGPIFLLALFFLGGGILGAFYQPILRAVLGSAGL